MLSKRNRLCHFDSRRMNLLFGLTINLLLTLFATGCLDPCKDCSEPPTGGPGTFSKTGPLQEDRAFASSAILPNGNNVLVAGGGRLPGYLTRAMIFDPGSSAGFDPDAELNAARANHTATLLQNGHVLVAGGDNGIDALNS